MLADNRLFAAYQTERVFQIRAQTKYRRHIAKSGRQRNRVRHVSPRTTQHFAAVAHDRVVHALYNVAIVQQKTIGNIV
ncbi:Uncharacterised protein [Salmonella enterica subsp. enterica serovar Bovismorbificans]|uniref:Uncharacterized protein n=1 Tax=Salmonella enterica subsp. enterica serovar Bovismorbificans TaxID=58097 RepID=A0A655EMS5_SALET|nr:Uncharacterised protein [Salmonella enterica subsp. enterica serovar Typhi]CNU86709.1 Uncharacterised protein [Salmonella enterica subsp. enterica serovar Bovismorbificans]CNV26446.1 Uncharacterised protein [Salmonella enterica subsp. enterica serovar Bovismorbificans]